MTTALFIVSCLAAGLTVAMLTDLLRISPAAMNDHGELFK